MCRHKGRVLACLYAYQDKLSGRFALGAAASGVDLVGAVPSGWPSLHLPGLGYPAGQAIGMEAVGLVIVNFTSGMLTARSFAARKGYGIDPNQELRAFGPAFKCITVSRSFGSALMLSWSVPHTPALR